MLLMGDPSTAKSQFLKFASRTVGGSGCYANDDCLRAVTLDRNAWQVLNAGPQLKTLHWDVRECHVCFNSCHAMLQAPIAVYTSGKGSSAAGLTATVIKDSAGEFYLEVGAWFGGARLGGHEHQPTPCLSAG